MRIGNIIRLILLAVLLSIAGIAYARPPVEYNVAFDQAFRALHALLINPTHIFAQGNMGGGGSGTSYPFAFDGTTGGLLVYCVGGTCSGGGGGGGNVNITQILGAAPSLTNPLWVYPATGASWNITGSISNTSFAVTNAGTFGVQLNGSWPYSGALGSVSVSALPPITIANSSFGISGTLPAFASNPTIANTSFAVTNAGTFGVQLNGSWPYSGALGTVSLTGSLPAFASNPTIANTSFGISGTLPAFASNPTIANTTFGATVTAWGGGTLGAMANYGTSPGAVLAPGVNAYITGGTGLGVTGTFWQTTQPISAASGQIVDGADVALGTTTVARSTSTDTTSVAVIPVLKEISYMEQNPASRAVTNAGTFAVQAAATLNAETTKVIGTARVLGNTGAAFDAATGAAPPANGLLMAGLGSGATGGYMIAVPVSDSTAAINISSATTTLLITGVSGRQVRIGSIIENVGAADNIEWIEGTGGTCGTGTKQLGVASGGGTTSGTQEVWSASGGSRQGSGLGTIAQTYTAADSVCIVTSTTANVSISVQYTIY